MAGGRARRFGIGTRRLLVAAALAGLDTGASVVAARRMCSGTKEFDGQKGAPDGCAQEGQRQRQKPEEMSAGLALDTEPLRRVREIPDPDDLTRRPRPALPLATLRDGDEPVLVAAGYRARSRDDRRLPHFPAVGGAEGDHRRRILHDRFGAIAVGNRPVTALEVDDPPRYHDPVPSEAQTEPSRLGAQRQTTHPASEKDHGDEPVAHGRPS